MRVCIDGQGSEAWLVDLAENEKLGLAGFRLLTACENAVTKAELQDLARMVIALIDRRKGSAAAQDARLRLQRSATTFRP